MAGFNWYPTVRLEKLKIQMEDTNVSKTNILRSLLSGKKPLTLAAAQQDECLATKNIKPYPSGSQSHSLKVPPKLDTKIKDQGTSYEQSGETCMSGSTSLRSLDANAKPAFKMRIKPQKIDTKLVSHFSKCENHKQETDSNSQNEIKIEKVTTELVRRFPRNESLKEETDSKIGIKMQITAELVGPCPEYLNEKESSHFSGDKSFLTVIKQEKEFNESANDFSTNHFGNPVSIKKESDLFTDEFSNVYNYLLNTTCNDKNIECASILIVPEDELKNKTNRKLIGVSGESLQKFNENTSSKSSNKLQRRSKKYLSASERLKKIHRYWCIMCPFTRWSSIRTKQHSSMTHGVHICLLCSVTFNQRLDLRKHERIQHPREKTLSCALCLKKFIYKNQLIKHQVVYSNKGYYPCSNFPLKAKTRELNLIENKFECAHCSRRFKHKDSVRKHMILHDNVETSLAYPTCLPKFKCDRYLNRHLKNGCRYLPCEFCGYKFKSKSDLQAHRKKKHFHVLKLPKCQECKGIVSSKSEFRSYVRKYVLTNSCFLVLSSQSSQKAAENALAEAL